MKKSQQCPLCRNSAEYEPCDHGSKKHFWCDNCVEFQISLGAEYIFQTTNSKLHAQNSAQARKSNSDFVWVITTVNVKNENGEANAVITGKYLERLVLPSKVT